METQKLNLKEISLPIQLLLDEAMTPDYYTFLYFVYNNQLDNAYTICNIDSDNIDEMVHDEYLQVTKEFRERDYNGKSIQLNEPEVKLLPRGSALFEVQDTDSKFREFWMLFPSKVPDGQGGVRVLHAEGIDTHDFRVCKEKYNKLIKKSPGLHEQIIQGLKNQLVVDKHKMQYMRNMETYLNRRVWEGYQTVLIKKQEKVQGV